MKLTIDRTKWLRGEPISSKLLSSRTGEMCCLGFFSKACGYSDDEIMDEGDPGTILNRTKYPDWIYDYTNRISDSTNDLISTNDMTNGVSNDDGLCTEEWREKKIIEIFAEHGVEVEFVG